MWIARSSSSASAAEPASISSVQRCGPDGAGQIEMPSSGRWKRSTARRVNASHSGQAGGLSRSSRSISARLDEPLVEHDRLVVGAVGHREPDQRPEPQVAVGANDGRRATPR